MPQPPAEDALLYTLTSDTLVIADFRPRTRARPEPREQRRGKPPEQPRGQSRKQPPGPYRRLFARPGTLAFTLGNLTARLPMGMFGLSAVMMIAGSRGSYALAGAVTGTGLAATAVAGPWVARLVDRYGQARVAVPAAAVAALGSLALLLCVRYDAPDWTLFASYAATATTPNTGGMSRARWAHLLRDDPEALHTANSFEQAADELCFMLGPVLAAFLCGTFFPEAGTLAGALLLMTGVLLFAAQRSTEPPVRARAHTGPPFRALGPLLAVCLATGGVFGATDVVTVAFADAQGHRSAAGVLLALQAAGSCAAGVLYGALRPGGSATVRLSRCLAVMTALLALPLLAARTGSLPLLAGALLLAGLAIAPTMVTTMTLVQQRTGEDRLNEGMTLAVTGLLCGVAAGSAAGGRLVEHGPVTAGYAVPVTAAAAALVMSLALGRSSNRFTNPGTTH
ncbi:MFS transporter [Streptomyces sp. NPDC052682]|uniref:MFS transporter n=1 Tax=Streptomyces sp. NPDC052682 TaxID=3154954 RepID=UPI0034126256